MADVIGKAVFSSDHPAERWDAPNTVLVDTALISITDQPGVSITASGDAVRSEVTGPYTVSGIPAAGVGYTGKQTGVATTGTWEFPVTGGLTTTPQNTLVYAVVSSGAITSLTLTATSNKKFGKVNYPGDGYVKTAGILPVKIGVFA
jgi:hypothetical protein